MATEKIDFQMLILNDKFDGHFVPHIVNHAKDPVIFYEWKS
jgi:hypothetical protein